MKIGKLFTLLTWLFVIGLLAIIPCYAADMIPAHLGPSPDAPSNPVLTFLQQTVFPICTALVTGLATWLSKLLADKYHIEGLAKENNLLEQVAYQGITKAEELAAKYGGTNSNRKLNCAVAHIRSVMPKVTTEQAESMVHALLAQIPGVGATKETALLPPGSGLAATFLPVNEPAPAPDQPEAAAEEEAPAAEAAPPVPPPTAEDIAAAKDVLTRAGIAVTA
jgi:hypothetical protein